MRDEASYVEFVAARWAALFRLAYLLTGSERAAEDLLQTAFTKVFGSWDKVRRTESPEEYVRGVVVNGAVSDGRRRSRRPDVIADRDELWLLVAALSPQQRAVVVLGYYEDLSEAEIATVLGCAQGAVESQASAALRNLRVAVAVQPTGAGMTLHDEPTLRAALSQRGERPTVPPVLVDAPVAGGRRTIRVRRTRWATGVGAAAVVIAVAGAVTLQPDGPNSNGPGVPSSSAPARLKLADLPQGDPPAAPFAEGDTLYVNGVATDVEDGHLRSIVRGYDDETGAWTVATVRRTGRTSAVDLIDPDTGDKTVHVADGVIGAVVMSADARLLGWDEGGTARVHLWNVETRTSAGTLSFPFTPTCCDDPFLLEGIDGQGMVYGFGGTTMWVVPASGDSDPAVIRGLEESAVVVEAGAGRLVVYTNGPDSLRIGRLDGDRFVEEARMPGAQAVLSWDDQRVAYVDTDAVHIRDLATHGVTTIQLPSDATPNGALIWEDSTNLLVQVQASAGEAGGNAWLRCIAETGRCELATMFRDELPTVPIR